MQLIFAETLAIVLGLAAHAALPRRAMTGTLLLPAVAGAVCAVVWVGLTWVPVEQGGALMWLASIGIAVIATVTVGVLLRRARHRSDEARLAAA